MAFRITALCRTTGRISDLDVKVDEKTKQEKKTIYFTVVSDRPYKSTKVVNGKTIVERKSDYVFCKATGILAELIDKHCKTPTGKTTTGGKPIYVSRQLSISGHLEKYENTTSTTVKKPIIFSAVGAEEVQIGIRDEIQVKDNIPPAQVTLTKSEVPIVLEFTKKDVPFLDSMFVIHDIEFADKSPESNESTSLLGKGDGAISIKLGGGDSTSSVIDNGNSTRNGVKENDVSMDDKSKATDKENKSTNEVTSVDDGDMPDMFNEAITDGSAPF